MRYKTECAPRNHKTNLYLHGHEWSDKIWMWRYCKTGYAKELTHITVSPVPGNMQPSEIKVEMAFVGSKGNPFNSYISEKALSRSVSLLNTHTV